MEKTNKKRSQKKETEMECNIPYEFGPLLALACTLEIYGGGGSDIAKIMSQSSLSLCPTNIPSPSKRPSPSKKKIWLQTG